MSHSTAHVAECADDDVLVGVVQSSLILWLL